MTSLPDKLVLFDGVCGLCDKTVQFALDHDPKGVLRFATLQGDTAKDLIARHPELEGVDSVVFVEQVDGKERVHVRSKAVFRMASFLEGGGVKALSIFSILPGFLADAGYNLVASLRYKIFGKLDQCRIPQPSERARFLP
jgi:predicted DCC family thiol-disulfide oxidoreductase YuxK